MYFKSYFALFVKTINHIIASYDTIKLIIIQEESKSYKISFQKKSAFLFFFKYSIDVSRGQKILLYKTQRQHS